MDRLDHIICSNSDITSVDEELKQYDNLKKELQQIYENKGEAAKFQSKCMWAEKGERPTKYFFQSRKKKLQQEGNFRIRGRQGGDNKGGRADFVKNRELLQRSLHV